MQYPYTGSWPQILILDAKSTIADTLTSMQCMNSANCSVLYIPHAGKKSGNPDVDVQLRRLGMSVMAMEWRCCWDRLVVIHILNPTEIDHLVEVVRPFELHALQT